MKFSKDYRTKKIVYIKKEILKKVDELLKAHKKKLRAYDVIKKT